MRAMAMNIFKALCMTTSTKITRGKLDKTVKKNSPISVTGITYGENIVLTDLE